MAVAYDGAFAGSVSGGCVEAAVIEQAMEMLKTGESRLLEYGVDDERAWSVGLSCGGQIQILLERFPSFSDDLSSKEVGDTWMDALRRGQPHIIVSWIDGEDPCHCLVFPDGRFVGRHADGTDCAVEPALSAYEARRSALSQLEGRDVFIHAIRGKEVLLIVGATDIATHLVRLAKQFEFETIVIDPRPAFADLSRFDPAPDQMLSFWPDEAPAEVPLTTETYAVLLSHNPKIDDPALHSLLRSPVRYIGALGSRKTQEKRRKRLSDAGFTDDEINRIRGPVGLAIGASSPAEIALSIMAEIVAVRNGQPAPVIPRKA